MTAQALSSCQSVHMSGVWIHMAATSMRTQRLASDLVTKPLSFLCSCIFVPITYLTWPRQHHAQRTCTTKKDGTQASQSRPCAKTTYMIATLPLKVM